MNKSQIKHVIERYYDNLELMLHNIVSGFDVDTIHNFRLTYKNLRGFLRMLGEQQGTRFVTNITGGLHKTYQLLGNIRDLDLQQVRIISQKNACYNSLQSYLSKLRDEASVQKKRLSSVLLKEPLKKSRNNTASYLPTDFSIVDFQIYCQLKIAEIISIIESVHIKDRDIHKIRKALSDLYYNHKKHRESEPSVMLSAIFEGKDDAYLLKLLEQLGGYHDRCISIKMINKGSINDLKTTDQEVINKIKKCWVKEKQLSKVTIVKKLKTDMLPVSTYKQYDAEAANFA